jgi:hypothetical protein
MPADIFLFFTVETPPPPQERKSKAIKNITTKLNTVPLYVFDDCSVQV